MVLLPPDIDDLCVTTSWRVTGSREGSYRPRAVCSLKQAPYEAQSWFKLGSMSPRRRDGGWACSGGDTSAASPLAPCSLCLISPTRWVLRRGLVWRGCCQKAGIQEEQKYNLNKNKVRCLKLHVVRTQVHIFLLMIWSASSITILKINMT